jgi:hypothetical protein
MAGALNAHRANKEKVDVRMNAPRPVRCSVAVFWKNAFLLQD